jgi:hypothetical protein
MDIWAHTRVADIRAPGEADDGGMSDVKSASPLSGTPTAVCVRNDYNEYSNFCYPTPKAGKAVIRAPEKQKSK